jgi:hypothetical protein
MILVKRGVLGYNFKVIGVWRSLASARGLGPCCSLGSNSSSMLKVVLGEPFLALQYRLFATCHWQLAGRR